MSEIGAIDAFSGLSSLFQLNTQRTSSVNPFASVDEMSSVDNTDAQESPFQRPEEVIEALNLNDPKNRLKILNLFTTNQQQKALGLLGKEGLQTALKLFDKQKILNFMFNTSKQDISKVLTNVMPLEKAFEMVPQKELNKFILSDELDKSNFMDAFQNYSTEDLSKLIGSLTGTPQKSQTKQSMIATLDKIPLDSIQPMLATVKDKQKSTLVAKMTGTNNDLFNLIPKSILITPLTQTSKEDTLNGFSELDNETMTNMASELPQALIPLVLTMIPVEQLAKALIEKYPDIIQKALAAEAGNSSSFSVGSSSGAGVSSG